MENLLQRISISYPRIRFAAGNSFAWSPATKKVMYRAGADSDQAAWSLLHEVGHALLEHKSYALDFELLELEIAAWQKAKQLAAQYSLRIDEDHIENCLDTYRNWLYRRSICPSCTTKALQLDDHTAYTCFNCHATWRVTGSRLCRPYRQGEEHTKVATV